jgi:hypothetical protein
MYLLSIIYHIVLSRSTPYYITIPPPYIRYKEITPRGKL